MRELRIGRLSEFLVSYLGLGVVGLIVAVFDAKIGFWSIPAFLAPSLLARQMFIRSQALEEAHKELQDENRCSGPSRTRWPRSARTSGCRSPGYLHDDLAQVLFRLSIQVDVARKLMDKEDYQQVTEQLEKIRESKQETSDRIRALIRDLHRSPLGAKGLAEALESFTDEVGRDSGVIFHRDVEDIALPAPIALLVYHIAREGVMNALKHAQAPDVWISVRQRGEFIELELRDDGRRVRHLRARARGSLRHGDDARASPGRWRCLRRGERPRRGRHDHGQVPDLAAAAGRAGRDCAREPGGARDARARCFPRYIWNQRDGGRRFSPDRPSMTSTTKHATPA